MRVLLINQNPVVSKLVGLSAQKVGVEVEEFSSLESVQKGDFDLLMIDEAQVGEHDPYTLKSLTGAKRVCLFYSHESDRFDGYEYKLHKPFLPTELVDLLNEIEEDLHLPELEVEEPLTVKTEASNKSKGHNEVSESEDRLDDLLQELDNEGKEDADASEGEDQEIDLDDLLAEFEESESQRPKQNVEEKREEKPELDLDDLLIQLDEEAMDAAQENEGDEEEKEEIDLDNLLADLEVNEEEEEPQEVTAPAEEGVGVLNEELVSEVKDLLDEEEGSVKEAEPSIIEESDVSESISLSKEESKSDEASQEAESFSVQEAKGEELSNDSEREKTFKGAKELSDLREEGTESLLPDIETQELGQEELTEESLQELWEEEPVENLQEELIDRAGKANAFHAESEVPIEPSKESEVKEEFFAEFDALSEEELLSALGEEKAKESEIAQSDAQEKSSAAEVAKSAASTHNEQALISTLSGMDPEALRKLLAGAQITINIIFPKEV